MVQKHRFVEKNFKMLQKLTTQGYISPKLLNDYRAFKLYMATKDPSKMRRYAEVGKTLNMKPRMVREAVYNMKVYVRD